MFACLLLRDLAWTAEVRTASQREEQERGERRANHGLLIFGWKPDEVSETTTRGGTSNYGDYNH